MITFRAKVIPLFIGTVLAAQAQAQTEASLRRLFDAIVHVESGDDPAAVGKAGERGVAQIRQCLLDDVNRIAKKQLTLTDVLERHGAWICFKIYANHYSKGCSLEVIARRWNGGPRGDKKKATLAYWKKVKAAMKRATA